MNNKSNAVKKLRVSGFGVVDMARLMEKSKQLRSVRAANTRKAYQHEWKQFEAWCLQAGCASMPATAETLALYATSMIEREYRLSTVNLACAAVASRHVEAGHPSPFGPGVRSVLSGARRELKEEPHGKQALSARQLREVSKALDTKLARDMRDRALLVFGFASGMRRSEMCRLNLADVEFTELGLKVRLGFSKNDQEAKGRDIGIHRGRYADTCPERTLRAWLKIRGMTPGPLFSCVERWGSAAPTHRLDAQSVNLAVKKAVQRIGLDPAPYGAHSLRAGCVTTSYENGATELAIMQRTGHKSVQSVKRYVRPLTVFTVNPLARVL